MPLHALRILGTRGVPAVHGGFETFAERLALHLVGCGWKVVVYCQAQGPQRTWVDSWHGVERVHIAVPGDGPRSTVAFDWHAARHAASAGEPCLTLGYNTAVFCTWLRLRGVPNVINMDGIEWRRAKWGAAARLWFWLNDWVGCWVGDALVADHPAIADHLATRVRRSKIATIAYGADELHGGDEQAVRQLGLTPGRYLTLVARAEPENSVLDVVRGFSRRPRGMRLAVLGHYADSHPYQRAVKAAAGDEVMFLGPIYDRRTVQALRWHSVAYVHGHQVGGTNPSLVEALGAGNPVIAHDNRFNRWVAGSGAEYFDGELAFDAALHRVLADSGRLAAMARASRERFSCSFTWEQVLSDYTAMLQLWQSQGAGRAHRATTAP